MEYRTNITAQYAGVVSFIFVFFFKIFLSHSALTAISHCQHKGLDTNFAPSEVARNSQIQFCLFNFLNYINQSTIRRRLVVFETIALLNLTCNVMDNEKSLSPGRPLLMSKFMST